jgi:hypothetical protein
MAQIHNKITSEITSEESLIGEFWAPLAANFPGAFGLSDDCAVIAPPGGCELVVTTDAVIAGVHVLDDEEPGSIAWKALAVNVSDLIAGRQPGGLCDERLPGSPQRLASSSPMAPGKAQRLQLPAHQRRTDARRSRPSPSRPSAASPPGHAAR